MALLGHDPCLRPTTLPVSGAQLLRHGYTQLVAMTFAFELRDEFGCQPHHASRVQ